MPVRRSSSIARHVALTRAVPDSLARCELTHLDRVEIDLARARAQHAEYESALAALGCTVQHLPAAPDLPDSMFVEDTAVVLEEIAVIARPGAQSRRTEPAAVQQALAEYRSVTVMTPPGTLDGGDVLRLGRRLYVGISNRTNGDGMEQLADAVRPFDYEVVAIDDFSGCLHLKSAATQAGDRLVVINPAWVDGAMFDGYACVDVDPDEPQAANVLRIESYVLCAAAAPRTAERLRARGIDVRPVDVSELAKAEAGLTCCSLIFEP